MTKLAALAASTLMACCRLLAIDAGPRQECTELHDRIVALALDAGVNDVGVCIHGKLPRALGLCGELAACLSEDGRP